MTAIIGLTLAGLAFLALFLFGRRAGKDAAKAKAAEETVEQIVDGSRPVSSAERQRLRDKYKRP